MHNHTNSYNNIVHKQVHTAIIMRTGFYQSMTFFFSLPTEMPLYINFPLFSCLSTLHPFFLLLPVSLSPERQDAHAIVLSWPRLYWLSDVKLIKDSLQGVSVPVRGIKSWWWSDRPLIIILLLVRMREIITLQAQSVGTVGRHSICLFLPLSLPAISNFHFHQLHSVFSAFYLSLTHFPAMLPCSASPLGTNSNAVHILSLYTLTLPNNPQHLQFTAFVCVAVCEGVTESVLLIQYMLMFICNVHKAFSIQHFS